MKTKRVKVEYTGPGDDPRVMTVSSSEAEDLVRTGLWSIAKKKSSSTTDEEGQSNA